MSNKNKAAKSKESKQRTKASNSKNKFNYGRKFSKRNDRSDINTVQLAFLKMVTDKPYVAEEAIYHGTS